MTAADSEPQNRELDERPPDSTVEIVRDFYDSYGWKKKAGQDRYLGEILHEDLDETSQLYMDSNELRFHDTFESGGKIFLDAGSGAEPRTSMSQNFREHICVDVSAVGLMGAKEALGTRALYVVADLSALPFKDGSFDGVLASHCLYHIHKDLQPKVLRELYRVCYPGKNILVFYVSNHNLLSLAHNTGKAGIQMISFFIDRLRRILKRARPAPETPPLYSYTYNPHRLAREFKKVDVRCLRTLTKFDMQLLRKLHLLKPAVAVLSYLERAFPHSMVYFGKYSAITIQKGE